MPGLETGSNLLFLEIQKRSSFSSFHMLCGTLRYWMSTYLIFQVVLYKSSGKGWEADGSLDQHDLRVTGIDWAPKTNR